ncbi:alkaline phosphatase D family protein [Aestuariibacter salexigens]|uniref:alkaline phosphatase D family protein n=1 Tax=Aestuariibacter salexigens TaxID=226010 RepID=UPI00040761FD|nr:alkaline phosphatase D family protein [Aestuariibacter salexigens]
MNCVNSRATIRHRITKWLKTLGYSLLLMLPLHGYSYDGVSFPAEVSRIAIGSCAKQHLPQPIWTTIADKEPDLFLFIGDNVYADVDRHGTWLDGPVLDPQRFSNAYGALANVPEFAAFRQKTPFIGSWDDHDYGLNDGGADYPLKSVSQQAFLDFFGFADDDPVRTQQGIYHARIMGEPGRRVQVIVLDTRFHRTALTRNPAGRPDNKGPYLPNKDDTGTMLGEAQWQWLTEQLKQPAEIRFIISSVQVVAYQHAWETWGNMPHERQRLYDLIASTGAQGVMFISGDRHLMEVSKDTGLAGFTVPYPMWDFTSSGMTDDIKEVNEENRYRVGPVYRGSHFAVIDIDWGESPADTHIRFTGHDASGKQIINTTVALETLAP